ncbi:LysE family translocator [Streptomonospora salina]|uniref:Threonine/homoserine/homoserine lactone efflux protein n=1 Tax=Streptomonospora salina TaxID=104205 RepID=A0A841EAW0_9ACTN|nr:LysE family translocator [Streptomonospora salina]MBB5996601.1 threonine/homoserine/homoserine lactone efflux protein [Streptomonospora salina]
MVAHLPVFLTTVILMLVVPGPDFVLVTRSAVANGTRGALYTVAGICGGLAFLTLAAAGLAAAVAADPVLASVLRVAGGVYLFLLGSGFVVAAWRNRAAPPAEAAAPRKAGSAFVQGFLNNVLNPKALVFYLTFMPQFLVAGEPVFAQTVVMGAVVVACAGAWWTLYIAALGSLGPVLRRPGVRSTVDAGAGAALAALGLAAVAGLL